MIDEGPLTQSNLYSVYNSVGSTVVPYVMEVVVFAALYPAASDCNDWLIRWTTCDSPWFSRDKNSTSTCSISISQSFGSRQDNLNYLFTIVAIEEERSTSAVDLCAGIRLSTSTAKMIRLMDVRLEANSKAPIQNVCSSRDNLSCGHICRPILADFCGSHPELKTRIAAEDALTACTVHG